MRAQFCRRKGLAGLLLIAASLVAGCGQEIEILQYPEFYDPDDPAKNIKNVVVLPFRNQAAKASSANAGEAMSEDFASLIAQSNTYVNVYNRNDLANLMNHQDLQIALGADTKAAAAALKRRGAVEAMVTGAVTSYASTPPQHHKVPIMIPVYNPRTKRMTMKTQYIDMYKSSANVKATATLMRVDGRRVRGGSGLAEGVCNVDAASPVSEVECLRRATNSVLYRLREYFVVVRKRVTVESDAFLVARSYYEGEWEEEDEFTTSDKDAFVVLKLPPQCDRNRFKVKIAREDVRKDLLVQEVRWLRSKRPVFAGSPDMVEGGRIGIGVVKFSPRDIAAKGGGPGKYVAKFYAGPKPALVYEFDIEVPH